MYYSSDIAQKIKLLAKNKNVSVKQMLEDLNLGFNMLTNMKKSMPKADNIARIADYLDCSVDYLLGRTIAETKINSNNTISGNNNIIGSGNSVGEKLSEHEAALIDIFKKLDVIKQAQLLTYAVELSKE